MVSCFALDRCGCTSFDVFQICWDMSSPQGFPQISCNTWRRRSSASSRASKEPTNPPGTTASSFRITSKALRPWHFSEKMKFQSNCANFWYQHRCGPSNMTHRIVHLLCSASKTKSARCWPWRSRSSDCSNRIHITYFQYSHIPIFMMIEWLRWSFMVLLCPRLTAKLLEPKLWSPAAPTPQRSVPCPAGSTNKPCTKTTAPQLRSKRRSQKTNGFWKTQHTSCGWMNYASVYMYYV